MEWIAPGNKTYNQQQRPHFFKEMKELAGEPNHSIHQQSTTSKTNQIQLIDFPLLLKCWLDSINYYNSNLYIEIDQLVNLFTVIIFILILSYQLNSSFTQSKIKLFWFVDEFERESWSWVAAPLINKSINSINSLNAVNWLRIDDWLTCCAGPASRLFASFTNKFILFHLFVHSAHLLAAASRQSTIHSIPKSFHSLLICLFPPPT